MEMRKRDNNQAKDVVRYGYNLTYIICDKLTYDTLVVKLFAYVVEQKIQFKS